MNDRSSEMIKQLNRLANDRSPSPQVGNKVPDEAQHIRELQHKLSERMREELAEY